MKFAILIQLTIAALSTAQIASAQNVDPHLYALEKNGVVSYVLGTIHFGVEVRELPQFVTEAMAQKPIFVTEKLPREAKTNLTDRFSSLGEETQRALRQRGMSKADFNRFRPDAACMGYLYWDYLDQNLTNGEVMDSQFVRLAKAKGKKLEELDVSRRLVDNAMKEIFNPCDIESYIAQYPPEFVGVMIKEALAPENDQYKFNGEAYLNNGDENFASTLARNEAWLPILLKHSRKGFFAVVGFSHLDPLHPKGLLSLFRQRGFKVTRISDEKEFLRHH